MKKFVKSVIIRLLPKLIRNAARKHRSSMRASKRLQEPFVTYSRLRDDLGQAGLQSGMVVMVHSALSKIGNVEGGATTVIQSLIDAVSPSGTVLMPSYNSADLAFQSTIEGNYVDLRTLPSTTGKITEVFRTWPGVLRSSHPFSPVCAWGAEAAYFTNGHENDPHICHRDSPIGRLVERGGTILGIGVALGPGLGVAHYLEDTWEEFPLQVHAAPAAVKYFNAAGEMVSRMVVRYDPAVAQTRIDQPGGVWISNKMTKHLARKKTLNPFECGKADAWLINAAEVYNELKRLALKRITIYSTPAQLSQEGIMSGTW